MGPPCRLWSTASQVREGLSTGRHCRLQQFQGQDAGRMGDGGEGRLVPGERPGRVWPSLAHRMLGGVALAQPGDGTHRPWDPTFGGTAWLFDLLLRDFRQIPDPIGASVSSSAK